MNPVITNHDTVGLIMANAVFENNIVTGTTGTMSSGTILARNSATGKVVPYVDGGADGTGTPIAILTEDLVYEADGDKNVDILISGQVRLKKIFTAAAPTTPVTQAVVDQLRSFTILARGTTENLSLDNQ